MRILYTILFTLSVLCVQAQNVVFSFEVEYAAPDAIVTILANTDAGTEDLSTFTTAFYFQDSNSDFDPSTGWAASPGSPYAASSTITAAANTNTNADVVGYDFRIEVLADDPTLAGFSVGTEPVELYTLTFTDVADPDLDDFFIGAADTEGATAQYYNASAFSFHDVVITGERSASLPIILKSFEANKFSETSAIVNWTTSSEKNASHFEVERSTDNIDWTYVGKVDAAGNSYTDQSYDLIDKNVPLQKRGSVEVFYYRLKMVDLDGAYDYSPLDAVRFESIDRKGFTIFPNPTVESIFVSLEGMGDEPTLLSVIDREGKLVMTQNLFNGEDERVSLQELPSGTYFITINQKGETLTQKVIKMD